MFFSSPFFCPLLSCAISTETHPGLNDSNNIANVYCAITL